jgi:hypothetical protein
MHASLASSSSFSQFAFSLSRYAHLHTHSVHAGHICVFTRLPHPWMTPMTTAYIAGRDPVPADPLSSSIFFCENKSKAN